MRLATYLSYARSPVGYGEPGEAVIEINAITLATQNMAAAVAFWEAVGLTCVYGGSDGPFTTFQFGVNFVNIFAADEIHSGFWGRVVFHVDSPDELWRQLADAGYKSETEPADAPWGERYFHILDADGHELSFARRLDAT